MKTKKDLQLEKIKEFNHMENLVKEDDVVKLTEDEMKAIMHNHSIDDCTEDERAQVFEFAFGAKFMASKNKGAKVTYRE